MLFTFGICRLDVDCAALGRDSVCRLSCHCPTTLASSRTLVHDIFVERSDRWRRRRYGGENGG